MLRPPVIAISFRIQEIKLGLKDEDTGSGLQFALKGMFFNAAIEGVKMVGRKGMNCTIQSLSMITELNSSSKSKSNSIKLRSNRIIRKPLLHGSTLMEMEEKSVDETTTDKDQGLKSKAVDITIEILRLKMNQKPSKMLYCSLSKSESSQNDSNPPTKATISPCVCKATSVSVETVKTGENTFESETERQQATFVFDYSRKESIKERANAAQLSYIYTQERRSVNLALVVRDGKEDFTTGSGWLPSFGFFKSSKEHKAVIDENDTIRGEATVSIPMSSIGDLSFSRLSNEASSYDAWYWLENDKGEALIRITKSKTKILENDDVTIANISRPGDSLSLEKPLINIESVFHLSAGYLDTATAFSFSRPVIVAHKDLPDVINKLSEVYLASDEEKKTEITQSKTTNTEKKGFAWRNSKILLDINVFNDSNSETCGLKVSCGKEHLVTGAMQENDVDVLELTLGETQNLQQLIHLNPDATIKIETHDERSLIFNLASLVSLEINSQMSLFKTDEMFYHLSSSNSENVIDIRDYEGHDEKSSTGENLKISFTIRKFAREKPHSKDESQSSNSNVNSNSNSNGKELDHFSDLKNWIIPEQGDILGITQFPPLLEKNVTELHIQILQAQNLTSADVTGTSDAYCLLKCRGEEYRTHVENSTLDPIWFKSEENEKTTHFVFGPIPAGSVVDIDADNPHSEDELILMVKDKDFIGEDDLIGLAHLQLSDLFKNLYPENHCQIDIQIDPTKTKTSWVGLKSFKSIEVY